MNVSVDAAQEPLEVYHYIRCLTACAELLHAARLHAGTHTEENAKLRGNVLQSLQHCKHACITHHLNLLLQSKPQKRMV